MNSLPSGPSASSDRVEWQRWSREPFERAAADRRPVLLSITASWCHGCAVMDRTTYADPSIVATINARTVPVRIDADRRPDINDRYNLDGWPTTALLTPSGEILTGSTYVTPDVMPRMLAEACEAMRDRYDDLMARAERAAAARRAGSPAPRYEIDAGAPHWMASRLDAELDREFGGFGSGGKFLPSAPLQFAIARCAAGDESMAAIAAATLDGLVNGGLFDAVDGGFFRYAAGRDWSRPHTEKMLHDQAVLVSLLLEAAHLLDRPDLTERARDCMAYVGRTLSDRTRGGFYASQQADDEYHAVNASIRETMAPPPVDRTLFIDRNAQAAAAWLRAGALLGEVEVSRFGLRSLERVLLATYRPGAGVAHFVPGEGDEEVRGLLTDHVHAAWALLDLHEATANDTYGMLAEELMRSAIRTMWDEAHGGFRDRAGAGPDDVGLLNDPVKPFALNCLAARVLARLAARTGQQELDGFARAALASQTGVYRTRGVDGAPYATAVLEVSG